MQEKKVSFSDFPKKSCVRQDWKLIAGVSAASPGF
jgi:hypothetical protein